MKTLRNFFALFVMGALVLASCEKKNEGGAAVDPAPAPGEDEPEVVFPEIMPAIDAPGAGSVTIAIYVPSNTCKGAVLVGAGLGEAGADDWNPGAKNNPFVELAGEPRWYTITVPYAANIGAKVIALTADEKADWATQWGKNVEGEEPNVVILSGTGSLDNSENDGEVKLLGLADGEVVFVGIKEWKAAPCVERNKAGKALFTANVGENFPADAILGVVGKINDEQNWNNDTPLLLVKGEGNVWTLEADVFDACEYKYRASLDGGATWIWSEGDNIQMVLDLKPVDSPVFNLEPAPAE